MPRYKLLLAFPTQIFVPFHALPLYLYPFDPAAAPGITFDLTSFSRPYVPPVTLELGPGALPPDTALCKHAFSSLYQILLAP